MPTSTSSVVNGAYTSSLDVENENNFRNSVSIDFPCMPETIDLVRSTDYAVDSTLVTPDGIHQYRSTRPLEIPVSFKLHFQDSRYCKDGALTLLQLASRLHSIILPISTFNRAVSVAPQFSNTTADGENPDAAKGQPNAAQMQKNAAGATLYGVQRLGNESGNIFAPVTCLLQLMYSGPNMPGIVCIGYVKDVKVSFQGPWLRGPNASYNLPSSCEYSFTFVHRPGHGNAIPFDTSQFPATMSESPQAFANDVKNKLYNTRSLVYQSNYQGFANDPAN